MAPSGADSEVESKFVGVAMISVMTSSAFHARNSPIFCRLRGRGGRLALLCAVKITERILRL